MSSKSVSARIASVALGLLVALAAAEIAARVRRARKLEAMQGEAINETVLYRPHHHLGYEIAPHAPSMRLRGPHNSLGLRGPEISGSPEGRARIVCLGGSSTYGTRQEAESECWPRQLESMLRGAHPDVEVVNAGVPAYQTADSLQELREKILPLKPRLLIVYQGNNDVIPRWMPGYRSDYAHQRTTWEYRPPGNGRCGPSALLAFLSERLGGAEPAIALRELTSRRYPETPEAETAAFETSKSATFGRNVRTMVDAARGAGASVLLVTQAYDPDRIDADLDFRGPCIRKGLAEHAEETRRVAAATGAALLDLEREFPAEGNFDDYVHHNAQGARAMARAVADAVEAKGLLAK